MTNDYLVPSLPFTTIEQASTTNNKTSIHSLSAQAICTQFLIRERRKYTLPRILNPPFTFQFPAHYLAQPSPYSHPNVARCRTSHFFTFKPQFLLPPFNRSNLLTNFPPILQQQTPLPPSNPQNFINNNLESLIPKTFTNHNQQRFPTYVKLPPPS